MSELQIQELLFETLKRQYRFVVKEAPIFSRSVDIVYVNEQEEVISIEIKVNDWRQAVKQAKDHQLVADKSYICLPHKKKGISDALLGLLEGTGIGLLIVKIDSNDVSVEEAKPAQNTDFSWQPSRVQLEKLVYAS